MELNASKRLYVHERLRDGVSNSDVGAYWASGRCSRQNSKYFHPQDSHRKSPSSYVGNKGFRKSLVWTREQNKVTDKVNKSMKKEHVVSNENDPKKVEESVKSKHNKSIETHTNKAKKSTKKVCKFWANGNCVKGDCCLYIHSWFCGEDITMLAKLQGHQKAITGIALPSGSDKLYSGSIDGGIRIWDCHTGQCTQTIPLGVEVGCLLNEDTWLFVGMPNTVKAWNIQTGTEFSLSGPVGQVNSLAVANEILFAGTEDGTILAWGICSKTNSFQPVASMKGHSQAIVSLIVGANRLYSGSTDHTIRAWDIDTLQCIMILNDHSDVVMSLICWDHYLLSCSLDCTIKVWAATASGSLEVVYTKKEEHGVLALGGMTDSKGNHILMCSCNDNSVRLYELPSFTEMDRLYAKEAVSAIRTGPGGLIFTGDGGGLLNVWKWNAQPKTQGCS